MNTLIYLNDNLDFIHQGNTFHGVAALREQSVNEAIVVLPAEAFSCLQVTIPTRNTANLMKALPFALEEQLLDKPEQLHFTPDAPDANGMRCVYVTRHEQMQAWMDILTEAEVTPTRMVPELALFRDPEKKDVTDVWLLPEKAIINNGADSAAVRFSNLGTVLNALELRETITITGFPGTPDAVFRGIRAQKRDEQFLDYLANHPRLNQAINCAHGRYQLAESRSDYTRSLFIIAGLVLVWLGVKIFGAWWEHHRLSNELSTFQAQISDSYKKANPKSRVNGVAPQKVAMQQKLKTLQGGDSHSSGRIAMLADVGNMVLAQRDISVQRVAIDKTKVKLYLNSKNLAALEAATNTVRKRYPQAELLSASGSEGDFSGVLSVGG
jgi:general secretion pathway protein L